MYYKISTFSSPSLPELTVPWVNVQRKMILPRRILMLQWLVIVAVLQIDDLPLFETGRVKPLPQQCLLLRQVLLPAEQLLLCVLVHLLVSSRLMLLVLVLLLSSRNLLLLILLILLILELKLLLLLLLVLLLLMLQLKMLMPKLRLLYPPLPFLLLLLLRHLD